MVSRDFHTLRKCQTVQKLRKFVLNFTPLRFKMNRVILLTEKSIFAEHDSSSLLPNDDDIDYSEHCSHSTKFSDCPKSEKRIFIPFENTRLSKN